MCSMIKLVIFISLLVHVDLIELPFKCRLNDFYASREICCNGIVFNKTSAVGKELTCCKGTGEVYDEEEMVCCGKQLRNKTLVKEHECCGQVFRKQDRGKCCNGRWHKNKVGHQWLCCGQNFYNINEDMCCEGVKRAMVPNGYCCGNRAFNTYSSYCDMGQIKPLVQSCSGKNYHIRDATCCDGNLYNHSISRPYLDCCGHSPFYPAIEKCEGSQVIPINYILCGSAYMNPDTDFCCNKQNYSYSSGKFCCNNRVVDANEEDCCNGKPFDKRNFKCCGGNIIKAVDECCGKQKLNIDTHVCCKGKALLITNNSKRDCCGRRLYDKLTQKCLSGKVYNERSARCGGKLVNSTSDLCCNSALYRGARISGFKCCNPGYKIYHPMNQSCCTGVIKNSKRCRHITETPFSCQSICSNHNPNLGNLPCKRFGMIVQAKKQKKTRQNRQDKQRFKGKKLLFAVRKVPKKQRKNISLKLKDKCSCIRKGSRFVLLTDEFPMGANPQYTMFPFSRRLMKQLRVYKKRCKRSIPYLDSTKRRLNSKKLD